MKKFNVTLEEIMKENYPIEDFMDEAGEGSEHRAKAIMERSSQHNVFTRNFIRKYMWAQSSDYIK